MYESVELTLTQFVLEQTTTSDPQNFAFGTGAHTCPGRFFAIHEVKLLVANIVSRYEFKLRDEHLARPLMPAAGLLYATDPDMGFLFKRRT